MKLFDALTKPFAGIARRDSVPLPGGGDDPDTGPIIPPSDTFLERAIRTIESCDEDKESTQDKIKRWLAVNFAFVAPLIAVYVSAGLIGDYFIRTAKDAPPDFALQMHLMSYLLEGLLAAITYAVANILKKKKLERKQVVILVCGVVAWLLLMLATSVAQYFIMMQYQQATSQLAMDMLLLRVACTASADVLSVLITSLYKGKTIQDEIDRNTRIQDGIHKLKESEMAVRRTFALVERVEQEERQIVAERTLMIQQAMRMTALVNEIATQKFEESLKLPSGEDNDGRRMRR